MTLRTKQNKTKTQRKKTKKWKNKKEEEQERRKQNAFKGSLLTVGEGDRGQETGRKGGRRCTGGGRREGGKRDSQGGGKREKKMQHCAIFRNRKLQRGGSQQIQGGDRD